MEATRGRGQNGQTLTRGAVKSLLSTLNGECLVLYETPVNSSVADAVVLAKDGDSERIIAIEAKSLVDRMDRATLQCREYRKWADEVYLAVQGEPGRQKIKGSLKREVSSGRLGLIVTGRGEALVMPPSQPARPDYRWLVIASRKDCILALCRELGIPAIGSWTKPRLLAFLKSNEHRRYVAREAFIRTLLRHP